MKEQNKTPEKELNKTVYSQPIRCRVQNTGDQDAQRTQYGHSIKEEMKFRLSEIFKKIYRETTVKRRKPGLKSTIWNIRKK